MYGFLKVSNAFPEECAIVGRLLAGYSVMEFGLMVCVNAAIEDFDAVFKTMFRTRGETQRIDIADAMSRHKFHTIQLGTQFEMAIGNMQRCLKIRNQFAHCHWAEKPGRMGFVDMEELAKTSSATFTGKFTY